eukprot:5050459-Pleurochrysis_carterae.AAC.2
MRERENESIREKFAKRWGGALTSERPMRCVNHGTASLLLSVDFFQLARARQVNVGVVELPAVLVRVAGGLVMRRLGGGEEAINGVCERERERERARARERGGEREKVCVRERV